MGENHEASTPNAAYGAVLLCCAISYTILQRVILTAQGPDSTLGQAVGSDLKGMLSLAAYAAAIPLAFVNQWLSDAIYVSVALVWLVPDRRIESTVKQERKCPGPGVPGCAAGCPRVRLVTSPLVV